MKATGSPTASARKRESVFEEDWLSSVEIGAWSVIVDGSNVRGTSLLKILVDEHKNA